MNIRPRAEETQPLQVELPPTQACFASPISCRGDARARDWLVRPWRKPRREHVSNDDAERLRAERKAQRQAHYLANREQILARNKVYKAANREKQRAYAAAHWEATKEQQKARFRAYYAANREKRLAYMAAYRAARHAARKQSR
jgi:hypothetical protein